MNYSCFSMANSTVNNVLFYFGENNEIIVQRKLEHLKEIDQLLNQLEEDVTKISLKKGEHDQKIETCLTFCKEKNDIEGVKRLAYIAFAGIGDFDFKEKAILYTMIHCKDVTLEDFIPIFRVALTSFKENWQPKPFIQNSLEVNQIAQEKFWGQETLQPTDKVSISHGGGLYYLKETFNGKKEGYENGCIWVSTKEYGRDADYATRTPPRHFDTPFIFKGEIEAQYLKTVPNSYEALLPVKWISKIENIKGNLVSYPIVRHRLPVIGAIAVNNFFEKHSSLNDKHPDLRKRIIKLIEQK